VKIILSACRVATAGAETRATLLSA
jgi:hypothetical protein